MIRQKKNAKKAIFSAVLLALTLGLFGCGKDTTEITQARRSLEGSEAVKLREQLEDSSVSEVTLDGDVVVMGCLVVNGDKTLKGSGTILLSTAAKSGVYQDVTMFDDPVAMDADAFDQMMESSLIYVKSGATFTVEGEITLDSNQVGSGLVVEKGGSLSLGEGITLADGYLCNLYNEGNVTIADGTISGALGYNVINAGTLTLAGGALDGASSRGNVYNTGDLSITDGTIENGGTNNIYLADGQAKIDGGTISGAKSINLYIGAVAKATVSGDAKITSGATGVVNYGSFTLSDGKLDKNQANLKNYGTAKVEDSSITSSSIDNVVNEEGASITFKNSDVTSSGARSVVNNKGTVSFENLTVRRSNGEAVLNNGGTLKGETLVIYGATGPALDNMDAVDGTGGNVTVKGLEIQTGSGMNVVQESSGRMELNDAVIGITAVTSVKVISGTLVADNMEIQGTSSTGAGIWTVGGKLEITNSTISDTKGRGLALAAGEITGKNLTFSNIVNTGIDVQKHDNGYSSATATFSNISFSGGERDNVTVTADRASLTINGGSFGKTKGNNARATAGNMTLNNVKILGNELGDYGKCGGVYLSGGTITLNDCTIRDSLAYAIRNKGGEVYGTNLKTYNTPAAAISNAKTDEGKYGNITIKGLEVYGAELGAVRNDCPGTLSITDATFCESQANIVLVSDGTLELNDVVVGGTINGEKNSYHNVYVTGGTLKMTSVTLKDSASSGIRQKGGTVIGDKVTITNASVNNINISGGKTTLKNSVLKTTPRTSVNLVAADAAVELSNTLVEGAGDLDGNNVYCIYIAPNAVATLNEGTKVTGSATRAGVMNEGGKLYVDNAEFYDNATRGITLQKKTVTDKTTNEVTVYTPYAEIKNASIHDNGSGTVSGGAIYNEGYATISGGTFKNNVAHTGGAINVSSDSTTIIENVTIKNNEAKYSAENKNGNGGAIHVSGGATVTLKGGTISGNKADGNGDAIRVNSKYFGMYDGAVVASDNDIYLESGINISTNANGVGNTSDSPMAITCANTTFGTTIFSCKTDANAKTISPSVACYNTSGALVDSSAFEDMVVIGAEGEVAWTARVLQPDGSYVKYLTIQDAFNAVPTNGVQTRVEIMRSVNISAYLDVYQDTNRNILLTDDGNGPYTLTRSATKQPIIVLRTGNEMTIEGSSKDDENPSLILDGGTIAAATDQTLIKVGTSAANSKATLTMNAGVQLSNSKSTSAGAGVRTYGKFYMYGGLITGNTSSANGAGVHVESTGVFYMYGGTIRNNTTTAKGGGVGMDASGVMYLEDGVITGNTAKAEGGGIYLNSNSQVTINGGTISKNKGSAGGGICTICGAKTQSASVTINGGTISGNTATGNGGGVFAHANTVLTVAGGSITGNTGTAGGGVYLHNNASYGAAKLTMTGGSITGNTATGNGGGVGMAAAANSIVMTGGTISDNTMGSGKLGKDIYNVGTLSMEGGTYVGGIYLATGKTISLTSDLSERNEQTIVSLSAYTDGTQVLSGEETVISKNYEYFTLPEDNLSIINEKGVLETEEIPDYAARVLQSNGKYVGYMTLAEAIEAVPTDGTQTRVEVMKDITLDEAIDITQDSNRNILLTDDGNGPYTITRNVSATLIILRKGNQMTIEGSSKDDQNPSLIIDGGKMTAVTDQTLIKVGTNATTNYDATLTLNAGVKLTNNYSKSNGSGIRVFGTFTMNGGVITGVTTTLQGAGVGIETTGQMIMNGGSITGNTATKEGGGIVLLGNSKFTMNGGEISGNKGTAGAGICSICSAATQSVTITINKGSITGNTGTGNGGGIFAHARTALTINDCNISGNKGAAGGGVYLHNNASYGAAKLTMTGGSITGNTATGNGGGVGMAAAANSLVMTGGTISDNTMGSGKLGKDVYNPGTVSMAGEAYVGGIYLVAGKTIAITAPLSARKDTTEVTLPNASYVAGTVVLTGGDEDVLAASEYFTVANTGFYVGSDGKLAEQTQLFSLLKSIASLF